MIYTIKRFLMEVLKVWKSEIFSLPSAVYLSLFSFFII